MKKEPQSKKQTSTKSAKTTRTTRTTRTTKAKKHTWIETLEQHRSDGKNWVFISGFNAVSTEADTSRVYLDASLQQAIDIPKDAILHSEKSTTTSLLGGIYVWIDQEQWGNCIYRYMS